MKNNEYCKRQYQLAMLRAQWWLTSTTSGHYKTRRIFHGPLTTPGHEFTDEEKLEAAMQTAKRHIEFASECSEALAEEQE